VSYGTSGHGSPSHVSGVLLQNVTDAKIQLVPYRGAALVMQDMVASTIQLSMFPVTVALPQVRAGHVRAYAITAPKRSAAAPDIPTVDEAGLPGFTFRCGGVLDAEGHAEGHHRQAERGRWSRRWPIRRRKSASPTRASTVRRATSRRRSARRLPEGRDREVVADRQSGEHQGAIGSI
jgi:hypothetical protein